MAGEQDIISLGLNIESFSPEKLAVLREFIAVFEKLQKFDGKSFDPVLGEGISKLNQSLIETNRLLTEINQRVEDISKKRITMKYPTKETKDFKDGVTAAGEATKGFTVNAGGMLQSLGALSKPLQGLLTNLRYLAFLIPGLGIAGIFNKAFEAIGFVIEAIAGAGDKTKELARISSEYNKTLLDQIKIWQELTRLEGEYYDNFSDLYDLATLSAPTYINLREAQEKLYKDTAAGLDKSILLQDELTIAQKKSAAALKELNEYKNPLGIGVTYQQQLVTLAKDVREQFQLAKSAAGDVTRLQDEITAKERERAFEPGINIGRRKVLQDEIDALKDQLKDAQSRYPVEKLKYEQLYAILRNYYEAEKELDAKNLEIQKFNDDEARRKKVETTKQDIEVNIAKNRAILADETKFHDARAKSLQEIHDKEVENARIEEYNIRANVSNTAATKAIAANKLNDDILKADEKLKNALRENDKEFYQRTILATTEINKDLIEQEAIKNEKIFVNDTNALDARLDAYQEYIRKVQEGINKTRDLALQAGAAGPGLPTGLIPEEQRRVTVHAEEQKYNAQADAERKNYDIVKSYIDRQIQLVKRMYEETDDIDKTAYAKELKANNDRFEKRIFQFEAFKKNYDTINKKYGFELSLEDQIKKETEQLTTYKKLNDDFTQKKVESDKKLEDSRKSLEEAKVSGKEDYILESQLRYDTELGINKALNDELEKLAKDISEKENNIKDADVKREKARYELLINMRKEMAGNMKQIEEEAWKLAGTLRHGNVENEIRDIERQNAARQQQYQMEEDAVEKSSLSAKDKAALDIQLKEQAVEMDKNAALEERKLKHDAAVKDRELAIAHVLWNTIEGVSAAMKLPPPFDAIIATQRAVLGAIAVAQILATPIPEYKFGVKDKKKGGISIYGEDGAEIVKIPGEKPFVVDKPTMGYLPRGTDVIPLTRNHPEFSGQKRDESWEQTKYLAKYIAKSNKKEIKNIFKPTIVVDMNFENRKRQILGN